MSHVRWSEGWSIFWWNNLSIFPSRVCGSSKTYDLIFARSIHSNKSRSISRSKDGIWPERIIYKTTQRTPCNHLATHNATPTYILLNFICWSLLLVVSFYIECFAPRQEKLWLNDERFSRFKFSWIKNVHQFLCVSVTHSCTFVKILNEDYKIEHENSMTRRRAALNLRPFFIEYCILNG